MSFYGLTALQGVGESHPKPPFVQTQRFLHNKYGSAVQLGPNLVSLSDPNLLRVLYNTRGDYLKV